MEQRQPGFAPSQWNTGWEPQETAFLTKKRGHKFEVRGVVADCFRFDRHYSRLYRLFRTVVFGEPFQLRKSGRNIYGASSVYTVLRIIPQSGGDAINVLCCGECGLVAVGDVVTMVVMRNQAGMPMLSFCLTRAHNFIKVVASPNTSMETILSLLQAYGYGCEKETDYCVEMDEAIDSESIEIFGIGI